MFYANGMAFWGEGRNMLRPCGCWQCIDETDIVS